MIVLQFVNLRKDRWDVLTVEIEHVDVATVMPQTQKGPKQQAKEQGQKGKLIGKALVYELGRIPRNVPGERNIPLS
ncbi:hypothetical protein CMV_005043 [Castanea mollissima]|uniref:Uncharacterized protein n=1 Tax=Castanea mollissima TaxID=60419 RepID=A0A8J4VSZ8_9ROSI|nr:hypothetical protein CMV_005043 [Castanea mollissima]